MIIGSVDSVELFTYFKKCVELSQCLLGSYNMLSMV